MKSLSQDPEQQYRHEEMCLLNHVVGVNSELDAMVPVALWNNIEAAFEVAMEVADVEVDEEMKLLILCTWWRLEVHIKTVEALHSSMSHFSTRLTNNS